MAICPFGPVLAYTDLSALISDMLVIAAASAAGALLVAWLFIPCVVRRVLDGRLRAEMAALRTDQAARFAQLHAELARLLTEHEERFSRLHGEQASILGELARRLSRCVTTAAHLANRDGSRDDLIRAAKSGLESYHEFVEYFDRHRMLFPEYLCTVMRRACPRVDNTMQRMALALEAGDTETFYRLQVEMQTRFDELIAPIRAKIESMIEELQSVEQAAAQE